MAPGFRRGLFHLYKKKRYLLVSMKTELIENIGFTEEEYNARTLGEDVASFDEFINAIVAFVEESGGSLEDAVDMANDAYFQL